MHTKTGGIEIRSEITPEMAEILTPEALAFVAGLERRFGARARELLEARKKEEQKRRKGIPLDFLPETKALRESAWKVAPIPADLQDRRVEITGPVDRKMIINALNSGAKCFMADLEDATTPGWEQVIIGQRNLKEAILGTLSYKSPEGKEYKLKSKNYPSPELAMLIVRPRGWHLPEKHLHIDGQPMRGSLLDFGLYFFHNAQALVVRGTGVYYYIPKLEHHLEAKLWDEVFAYAEKEFALPAGTIRATVLIETFPAAFQMEEILHAMKDHIVAQNAGRWDYIFSYIKNHAYDAAFVCPDRFQVTMTQPFLRSYSQLLIKTCHKRGAMAMGGMSALIPIKSDPAANEKAMAGVKADKEREAGDGHDGTWVAHPGLIPIAKEVFDRLMPGKNQLAKLREDVQVSAANLSEVPKGTITEAGIRNNISVALQYLASWLNGVGCVPIYNLMEDAATAEISRTQLWQFVYHGAKLDNGTVFTADIYHTWHKEEVARIRENFADIYDAGCLKKASGLLDKLVLADTLSEFLTLPAYALLG